MPCLQKKIRIAEDQRGENVRCPSCHHVQKVSDSQLKANPVAAKLMQSLSDLQDLEHAVPCPACTQEMPADETLCPHCGYNLTTGMTFEQAAQATGPHHTRAWHLPPFLAATLGTLKDLFRIITPKGVSPTVTGTGMLLVMTLIVCFGGTFVSNNMTGKAKHLKVKLVEELRTHLDKEYAGKIDSEYVAVIEPVYLELIPSNDVQNRVSYTGQLSIVTEGKRRIIGEVDGVFDAGLLFFGLELTDSHLTTNFNLYPDFMTLFARVQKR